MITIMMIAINKGDSMDKLYEKICYWLPKRLVYRVLLRAYAYSVSGKYGNTIVPDITMREVIDRWEKR